jgi:hypothetical protein
MYVCIPLLSNVCYMRRPSQLIWLGHSNHIWRRVRVMKLPITPLPPVSYYFIPLGVKFILSTLFSYSLGLCYSLEVRHQVSYPPKTKGKLRLLHVLISIFLDSRREDRTFWTKWKGALSEMNLLFICSWIKLWFVIIIPNILTLSQFQNIYYLSFSVCYVMILLWILLKRYQHIFSLNLVWSLQKWYPSIITSQFYYLSYKMVQY